MKQRFCVVFAGVVGSSKTPIAHHLGWNLGLPVFNNDILRTETTEDFLYFDQKEYIQRRDGRLDILLSSGQSFIYDASIDREWAGLFQRLEENGYQLFVISLDLSREFLSKLYEAKFYDESLERLDTLIDEHKKFLDQHASIVGFHITDQDFTNRLKLSLEAVTRWIHD